MKKFKDSFNNLMKNIGDKLDFRSDLKKDKVYCVYGDQEKGLNYCWGIMFFANIKCDFISGKYGEGQAPKGEFLAYHCYRYNIEKEPSRERMAKFGVSFQVPFATPNTGRDKLAIHFDGGNVGTLGCIGLHPKDKEHALQIVDAFKKWFIVHNQLEVEIT